MGQANLRRPRHASYTPLLLWMRHRCSPSVMLRDGCGVQRSGAPRRTMARNPNLDSPLTSWTSPETRGGIVVFGCWPVDSLALAAGPAQCLPSLARRIVALGVPRRDAPGTPGGSCRC